MCCPILSVVAHVHHRDVYLTSARHIFLRVFAHLQYVYRTSDVSNHMSNRRLDFFLRCLWFRMYVKPMSERRLYDVCIPQMLSRLSSHEPLNGNGVIFRVFIFHVLVHYQALLLKVCTIRLLTFAFLRVLCVC